MRLLEKAAKAKGYVDGSRNFVDLPVFWHRPRAWVGGELSNRLGLQPLRCIYQQLRHRPTTRNLPESLRSRGQELIDNGMVVIPNFLSDDIFQQVRAEYEQAYSAEGDSLQLATANKVNRSVAKYQGLDGVVQDMIISGARQQARKVTPSDFPITTKNILENPDVWALVSAALGKQVKYSPGAYFQRESRADPGVEDNEQNIVLHEDVFYSSLKAFFYINDNDAENGAFVVVPRSHRCNIKRLRHEYSYSIDVARQKQGKSVSHSVHPSGRMEVFGQVYDKDELTEVQAVGGANTLVIANVRAFHRRGGTAPEGERCQLRMSFRQVETWHHKLYPRFGTQGSARFQGKKYF